MAFIYADSCIIIYLTEGDLGRRMRIKKYLLDSESGQNRIGFSDLSRLECLVHPVREGNEHLRSVYETFFRGPRSHCITLTSEVFDRATEIRAKYGIKTPDAIHMAAALTGGCDIFLTNDLRLSKFDTGISIEVLEF